MSLRGSPVKRDNVFAVVENRGTLQSSVYSNSRAQRGVTV